MTVKSRHRAREIALQILYQYDLQPIPQGPALAQQLIGHFEHFSVPDSLREFVGQLVSGTLTERAGLDALLEEHAANWKVSRMSSIDRCLLRMASYEIRHFPEVPRTVIIDEAIELAKDFGTAESSAFINGVLDKIPAKTSGE